MSREWKPGDVAMVTLDGGDEQVAVHIGHDPADRCWHSARNNGDLRCAHADAATARPLVVIDPEDREQVERLRLAIGDQYLAAYECDAMQAALRSLTADPKPDEPQGLGAVVQDADGTRWTQVGVGCWIRRGGGLVGYGWGEIAAVRVLSEGVS